MNRPAGADGAGECRPETAPRPRDAPVWDPLLRSLHWTLAVLVAAAWATTAWFGSWHESIGWVALAVVVVRSAWGWLGPRHARFADFVRSPRAIWAYLRLLLRRVEPRYLGHNPLGACMVLALFVCVAVLAASGWLYRSPWLWGDETVEAVHRASAWLLVALVVLHVIGVAYASWRHRENLVAAMLDGAKRAAASDDID